MGVWLLMSGFPGENYLRDAHGTQPKETEVRPSLGACVQEQCGWRKQKLQKAEWEMGRAGEAVEALALGINRDIGE